MKNKTSEADAEVSEATTKSKKHVTLEEKPGSRSNSPKIKASSATGTDIRNRYLMIFHYLFIEMVVEEEEEKTDTCTHIYTMENCFFYFNENYARHIHTWSLKIEVK